MTSSEVNAVQVLPQLVFTQGYRRNLIPFPPCYIRGCQGTENPSHTPSKSPTAYFQFHDRHYYFGNKVAFFNSLSKYCELDEVYFIGNN